MSRRLLLALAFWATASAAGFGYLAAFAAAPSPAASAPSQWPAGTTLTRLAGRWTLVALLHPECPCSRATVAELARLVPRLGPDVDVHALFVVPPGLASSPQRTALWSSVRQIPGVTPLVDPGGRTASRFGAFTSGQVVLYDTRGALRFAGGITASRGHEGASVGEDAVEIAVLGAEGATRAPVFGCSLLGGNP